MPYNPKAPRRSITSNQSRSELDGFADRLRQLGATDDQVADVRANWDRFDEAEGWTPETRRQFVRQSDAKLRAVIAASIDEHRMHTRTDDDDAAITERMEAQRRLENAALVLDRASNVGEVLEWVGDDPGRAAAVLELEEADRRRKTLMEPLRNLAG